MALGVLDDNKLAEVPGTSLLDKGRIDELDTRILNLKTKHGVVLVPQPSDNVNDPYNWLGPIISPGLLVASKRYHVSLDQVSTFLIGVLILSIGSGTFFTAAAATIWGKRPDDVANFVELISYFKSFESLWIMRIVQGISAAPLETLVTSTVSDIFFVHERGQKLAIWGIAITSGVILRTILSNKFSQVVSGYIIQNLGLLTPFGITALVLCLLLPAIFFLVPETADVLHKSGQTNEKLTTAHGGKNAPKRTYSEELRVFNGRISDKSFWALAAKPLPLITFPAVIFSTFIHGSFLTWLVVFAILSTNVFTGPQYGLTPSQIGLINLPLLGVCLLGTPLSGAIADWLVCLMARRNNGIYEPEFRLLLMIPATIFSTAGFIGYGLSIDRGAAVAVPVTFMALHSLSIPFATSASFTYVIDCHPKDANQAFVTINFAKAVFIFIASMFVNGWYSARGPRVVFTWITGLNLAFSMMTIPILRGVPLLTNFEVNTYISTIRKIGCE
ncbi:predicted protein [Histoplasma mississippiense (nom. inval.)]|uniref:predicted protein n=1 Tax=Ajellomyces capsulatus (strain NAm1 / WU24) TaxID=2059318 RepID=UPI000157D1C6|nr:predicted protein [Histoplasma mississippiense (nom. inval.)]EDN10930.1 predicted protein [Histoplasma mississippiense (nom. inval.)]